MPNRSLDDVLDDVGRRVTPGEAERERLRETVDVVLKRAREAVAERDVEATVRLVGSAGRNTWLPDERDVDVFVSYPPDLDRAALEAEGLAVGRAVLPEGREEYAEHPYVAGTVDGFDVDVVPCYDVDVAADARSAVDRTPFHADYVADRLTDELAADVRIVKQLLRAFGAYGSDLRTRGFSGYLVELLVLEYGGTRGVLKAAADWHPPVQLDPAGHAAREFEGPLVVVDPTDPARNVAAVCSAENVARLQHHARAVLADPSVETWFPEPREPIDAGAVGEHVRARGTTPVALAFEAPDLVEDELYPQLQKSLDGVGDALDRLGFPTLRRTAFADGRAALMFELAVAERPAVERHPGPPVHVREHAERFLERYADDADVYGPFVEGNRYVVERERPHPTAVGYLGSDALLEARLGPAIAKALADGYELLVGVEVAALADEFGVELAAYFEPSP